VRNTLLFFSILTMPAAIAEVHNLTLREAVELALSQSPDMVLARLDERKAQAGVQVAKDPFVPKVYAGSGAAYTNGYPSPIEGNAPSIVQVRTQMSIFNRPRSYALAQARETARGATIETGVKADEVVYRTASLYLNAEQLARNVLSLQREADSLERVIESVQVRVQEGRELPIAAKRADLDLARARERYENAFADADYAEESLAIVLGFAAGDRAHPAEDDRKPPETPGSEEASVEAALANSKDLRRLESQLQAKGFELRGQKAARLPQIDLVAQYALFAKYNYVQFFQKFQRNNGQLGVSIQIPVLVGSAAAGQAAQAEEDITRLRTQFLDTRNRITVETRKGFQDIKKGERSRDVARLDLELARDQLSVLLAQLGEGRATRQAVDEARLAEQEKWIAYYDSLHTLDIARLNLLRQTGTITAALR
jgi:outer membrane protein